MKRRRLVLLGLAAALAVVAVLIAVSGGFRVTVGGFRVSARSPLAASVAALVAGAWWLVLARREGPAARDLDAAWQAIERQASRVIGTIALIAALVAAVFATRSAAGADASGYLSQAAMWTRGEWFVTEPLAEQLDQRDGRITAPLGWQATNARYQVPTYAPGLPLLMALPHAIAGIDGANAVVVASAAAAVWATGMIAGGVAGIFASMLLACAPAFLYQSIQPMSDVPVTAAWALCFLFLARPGASWWAGLACAIAVLVRPNLAPLAIVPLWMARERIAFAVPVVVAGVFVGFMQWLWYGSPLRSGYGTAGELFAWANVVPNAGLYARWLVATSPVLLIALFGFARSRSDRRAQGLLGFALLVIAAYLVYAVFDHWSYLRFLLPALVVLAVFTGVDLAAFLGRWPAAARAPLLLALLAIILAHGLWVARSLETFKLRDQLRRVSQVARLANDSAPPPAVIVAGEQSGSMRYYTQRSILRWDLAEPSLLPAAIERLEQAGRPVYIALDAWEEEPFRKKFGGIAAGALDWPAALDAGTSHRTRLWRLGDRARFRDGRPIQTIRLP